MSNVQAEFPGAKGGTWGTTVSCCGCMLSHPCRKSASRMGHPASLLWRLRALGGGDAGDALEIGGEVEVLEARGSEQGRDGGGLAEADFQGEVAAWGECGERGGN